MDMIFNMIEGIVLLGAGGFLLFVPYEKFKKLFPKAPSPVVVKIFGVFIAICGILVAILSLGI